MTRAARGTILAWARDEVYAAVDAAEDEVIVVSPFISTAIAREVSLRAEATSARVLQLLTCLSPTATATGVLDPRALLELLEAKWEIRSGRNLHAKAVFVDRKWGLLGSGNLTTRGFGGEGTRANAELGVVLSQAQVRRALEITAGWWQEAEPVDAEKIEKCPKPRRGGGKGRSAVGPDLGHEKPPAEPRPWRGRTGRWLKMVYDRRDRRGPEWWTTHDWVSDRHIFRDGKPIWRPSYECGDLLVLYVVGASCPAVLEVTRKAEFEPERVRDDPDSTPGDWKRWGWVTEVRCRQSVPVDKAPELGEIGVDSSSVRQHGHIELRPGQFARARAAILSAQG